MSVASAYAAAVAANQSTLNTAIAAAPAPFVGPLITMSVNTDGTLNLSVPSIGHSYPSVPAAQAAAVGNWLVANFV